MASEEMTGLLSLPCDGVHHKEDVLRNVPSDVYLDMDDIKGYMEGETREWPCKECLCAMIERLHPRDEKYRNMFFYERWLSGIFHQIKFLNFSMKQMYQSFVNRGDIYLTYDVRKKLANGIGSKLCGDKHVPEKTMLLQRLDMPPEDIRDDNKCKECLEYFFKENLTSWALLQQYCEEGRFAMAVKLVSFTPSNRLKLNQFPTSVLNVPHEAMANSAFHQIRWLILHGKHLGIHDCEFCKTEASINYDPDNEEDEEEEEEEEEKSCLGKRKHEDVFPCMDVVSNK